MSKFRKELRSIFSLAIGLVLATILCVAVVAHTVIPSLSWPSAFVLGAVVSPTDAVAAESIMQSLGLNRRIATIISGESLVNGVTRLVAYRFAIAAVSTGSFSLLNASTQFMLVSIGGIVIGLAIAWLAVWLYRWADNPLEQIIISIITPFATHLIAERLSTSGVIAMVAGGICLGRQSANFFAANTRLQSYAFWRVIVFLLNCLIFLLIGIQLGHLGFGKSSVLLLIEYAALISLTVIFVRLVWTFAVGFLLRQLNRFLPFHYHSIPALLIIGWSGMRGGISMATARLSPRPPRLAALSPGAIPSSLSPLASFFLLCCSRG
ncbi:sodium:proton antiporter [Ktedonobacter sp. SOSP1-52]|uniref:cation:proton antiporter n=1 Tax=Ktedonobacter sp. SOSP1-52 TaxID=2778366 RepID=UPI0019157DBF|nr:cation:proton antiporter [Ktedonobacter sp. SOSP1-52]